MHWRHVSITTTPCWGSRLVALRARVVLAERIGAQPLSQCEGPGQPGGMACRGWPAGCMLGDGARGSASFDPKHAGAPFCDVICIWSIGYNLQIHWTSTTKTNHFFRATLKSTVPKLIIIIFIILFIHHYMHYYLKRQRFAHVKKEKTEMKSQKVIKKELQKLLASWARCMPQTRASTVVT